MTLPPPIDPARDALLLDFDGTLVGFADDPQAVAIAAGALASLTRLQHELSGALAIVSGRRIADLDRFLEPLGFAAAGVHGLERRASPGAGIEHLVTAETLDPVRAALRAGLRDEPRLALEDKGTALVIHYRTAPELADAAKALAARAVAERSGLKIMHGNHIVEIHPAGMDKGLAVAALMQAAPFAGRRAIYVGDDTTDEFAFEALNAHGGITIKVGPGETAAAFRLPDVAAVHDWLGGLS